MKYLIIILLSISCVSPELCSFTAEVQAGRICNIYTNTDNNLDSISTTPFIVATNELQDSLDAYLVQNDLSAIGTVTFDPFDRSTRVEIDNTILSFDFVKYSNSPGCTFPEFEMFSKTCIE